MRNKRMELLLIVLTVLAMGAGVAAGLLAARLPAARTQPAMQGDVTPLVAELGLSPSQQDQMRSIWEGVRDEIRNSFDRAQRLQARRDDAILSILTDQQKAQFETIAREYADQFAQVTRDRDGAFQDGVKRTKTLLSGEQQEKYDRILEARGALPAPTASPGLQGKQQTPQ